MQSNIPALEIEAPPEFRTIRTRLESSDPNRFADIAQLVGITDPGPVIKVVLAPENSDLARRVSPWIAGFAAGGSDIFIFPTRSPSYPHGTLEDVLRHEVAHILIERASAGRPIPRWFNEGFAMTIEHAWRFEDQTQLLYQLVLGSRASLADMDRLFSGTQSDQTRAYALAGAFVRDLFQEHGLKISGEILMRVRRGASFDVAFTGVTGKTPTSANSEFWERQRIWTTWAPIITSSTTLWSVVTILALFAIHRRRKRNAEIEKQWDEEDQNDGEA